VTVGERAPAGSRYFAFADQDDVWDPNKLSVCLDRMRSTEGRLPGPVLVHSDLRVVSATLEQIAPSLAGFQGLQPARQNFGRMLVANSVTGCTMLINEALARQALPIPASAIMHDWWLALVARTTGTVIYVDSPLMDYRQHGANTFGARTARQTRGLFARLTRLQGADLMLQMADQARALRTQFAARVSGYQKLICWTTELLRIRIPLFQRIVYRILRRA
jgi:hypothetical protein